MVDFRYMRVHSDEKIKRLKSLRRKGHTINELVSELSIPKTTVWHHIQKVEVLPKYVSALRSRRGGSAKRRLENIEEAKLYAQQLLQGPHRERAIVLAMLYWAEGNKKSCEFINSDGSMIRLYLKILRNAFDLPESYIKPTMRIFTGMDEKECLSYWSEVTEIPKARFKIYLNDGGTRGKTKYGMCRITVKRGGQVLKVIHALKDQV